MCVILLLFHLSVTIFVLSYVQLYMYVYLILIHYYCIKFFLSLLVNERLCYVLEIRVCILN